MRKLMSYMLTIIIISITPFMIVKAEKYNVDYAEANEEKVQKTFDTYKDAELYRRTLKVSDTSVSVVRRESDGKVLSASAGIVKLNNTNIQEFEIRQWHQDYYPSAVINTNYGTDALYLNTATEGWTQAFAKIQISGVTGYVDIEKIDVIPMTHVGDKYQVIVKADTNITIRSTASTSGNSLGSVSKGQVYNYTKKTKAGGYTWYYINYSGNKYGWIASKGPSWVLEKTALNTYYYVNDNGDLVHKYESNVNGVYSLTIGKAPSYLKRGVNYYSFDAHYFYTNKFRMVDDVSKGYDVNGNAINAKTPYFAYFMYLPSHSLTGYEASNFDNIIASRGYTASTSKMYGIGQAYIDAQNKYGVNALLAFAKSSSESAFGTSYIAMQKNNLFGMGAYDSCAFECAIKYSSPSESVMKYAETVSKGSGYNNPSSWLYAGGHYGNKVSGMNKRYATDPYWGEIASTDAYSTDKKFGGMDNNSNTLGIKLSPSPIKVYKKPSSSSSVIYETRNGVYKDMSLPYLSFIVTEKVYTTENGKQVGFYKVYTDPTLDSNQNIAMNETYSFSKSYGYVKESDLYVENNQPVINASDIRTPSDVEVDFLKNVSATDKEDGNISNYITYETNINYDKPGTYKVTYTVSDKQKFSVSKTVNVIVEEASAPKIDFEDLEVSQYTEVDYLSGVAVIDKDSDIISKVQYTKTVDTTKLGTYKVTYTVTNSRNKTATKERNVIVIKNEAPVITGKNITVTKGDKVDLINLVSVTDKEDGKISDITYEAPDNYDTSIPGVYTIKYTAMDSAKNVSNFELSIIVEEKKYEIKTGIFYLNKMKFNDSSQKLEFNGFAIVKGINNKISSDARYDLIFENQNTGVPTVIPLDRWTKNVPFAAPNDKGLDYSGSWFNGSIDLSEVPQGDYTMYVRVRLGNYETKVLVSNEYFNNNISAKVADKNGRGYSFKTDYTTKAMGIQLFVRDKGLVASVNNPTIDNMYNQYYSINFSGNYLEIKGTSHNVKGNYASNAKVERSIYLENVDTLELTEYKDVGSITNGPYKVSLKVGDGYDKTRAWYSTKLDLTQLKKGRYAIYVRTKTGSIDDYGELYDLMFSKINASGTITTGSVTKIARIVRNDKKRYRLELVIE